MFHTQMCEEGPNDEDFAEKREQCIEGSSECCSSEYTALYHEPWYAGRFKDVHETADFWMRNYTILKDKSEQFSKAFYEQSLPGK